MTVVVLASRSPGKLRELAPMLRAAGYDPRTLDEVGVAAEPNEDAVETGATFEENALAKARYFFARAGGVPVLADDSGLVVDALGGAPGVRSRRWSGRTDLAGEALDRANNARLVEALAGVTDRGAAYVCVAVWCDGVGTVAARGETRGRITAEPRGTGGFGYDPYFWSDEVGGTFADVSPEAKEAVSHRGRAVRALLQQVRAER
jgi:XTP/dITP diphosphohydrolase